MKPQLDEIKAALAAATPGKDYEFGSRDKITANAPQWLTFLLEENERLKETCKRACEQKDAIIKKLASQTRQRREELDQERAAHNITSGFFDNLIIRSKEIEESLVSQVGAMQQELERITKERDQLQHRIRVVGLANDTLGRYVREAREELEQVKKEQDTLQQVKGDT